MGEKAEVLIIGGGPSGSVTAMRLLKHGIRPIILEREEFPRYHVGESMTGECGALLRKLGFDVSMTAAGHPIKHGVAIFGARGSQDWWVPVMSRDEHGLHDQTTWQVRRSEFDAMLLQAAVDQGARHITGRAVSPVVDDGVVGGVIARIGGRDVRIDADLTIDCSGQATFLANKKVTGQKYLGSYDKQIAIFAQIEGYQRNSGSDPAMQPGNTHIFYTRKYHWAWAIPIDSTVTSVGIVVPAAYYRSKKEKRDSFIKRELRELNEGLADRVTSTTLVEPAHTVPNYSYQVRRFAGPGYLCVGDSHRFVDPIFSFGLYVAIREAWMGASAAMEYLSMGGPGTDTPFRDHMIAAEKGIDILEDVTDAFWENPLAFAYLVHNRYRTPLIDVFAGRIYDDMPTDGSFDQAISDFRRLLNRDRTYDEDGLYSIPIGSRFHPERAPLWNSQLGDEQSTEAWLREAG